MPLKLPPFKCGRPQKKRSIISSDDLAAMYASLKPDGEILLWCDKRQTLPSGADVASNSQKRSTDNSDVPQSKRANRECKLEQLTDELKEIHGENYRYAQLKMWARMIEGQQWDSKEKPPPVPNGSYSKQESNSKDTTASALTDAAVAFAHALRGSPVKVAATQTTTISPGKNVQLSQQYLQQLKTIQALRDDGILTNQEFVDEKERVMCDLCSLK